MPMPRILPGPPAVLSKDNFCIIVMVNIADNSSVSEKEVLRRIL